MQINTSESSKTGFSLIEAAIVLGVVGLVIGGIWIAAAEVNRQHRLTQAVTGVEFILDDVRNSFKNMPFPTGDITDYVISSKAAPGTWIGTSTTTLIDPWGQPAKVYAQSIAACSVLPDSVSIEFPRLDKADCMRMIVDISKLAPHYFGGSAHMTLLTGNADDTSSYFCIGLTPISLATVGSMNLCPASYPAYRLMFQFGPN